MRLIDADAFREQLNSAYEYTELGEVIEMLDNAPTVDADVNCSYCDYFTFSRRFIKNVANLMANYKIEIVEDLMKELNHINEWLGGRE